MVKYAANTSPEVANARSPVSTTCWRSMFSQPLSATIIYLPARWLLCLLDCAARLLCALIGSNRGRGGRRCRARDEEFRTHLDGLHRTGRAGLDRDAEREHDQPGNEPRAEHQDADAL